MVEDAEPIEQPNPQVEAYKAKVQELEIHLEVANEAFIREVNAHKQTAVQLKFAQRRG